MLTWCTRFQSPGGPDGTGMWCTRLKSPEMAWRDPTEACPPLVPQGGLVGPYQGGPISTLPRGPGGTLMTRTPLKSPKKAWRYPNVSTRYKSL